MRLCLTVAYVGTRYAGWQVQPREPTVQGVLERAVATIAGDDTRITGASRTDAGVHAAGQVCHFDTSRSLPPERWRAAINGLLPADVRVLEARRVADDFSARHDARLKTYRYHLDPAAVASPFLAPFAWHRPGLQAAPMAAAAEALVGDLDQTRFASRHDDRERPVRPVESCTVDADRLITVTVVGRSFLRHAVRGMVGTLVDGGLARRTAADIEALVRGDSTARPALKAPAHGLCLARVEYGSLPC